MPKNFYCYLTKGRYGNLLEKSKDLKNQQVVYLVQHLGSELGV